MIIPKPKPFHLPFSEIDFSYVRSSGPGGQNVNKVNSKAVLRWRLTESAGIPEETRALLIAKLGPRLSREGDLIVTSDRHRDQKMNRDDCVEKLLALVNQALHVPKARKETKPTRSSKRRKRETKSRDGEKKRLREKVRL